MTGLSDLSHFLDERRGGTFGRNSDQVNGGYGVSKPMPPGDPAVSTAGCITITGESSWPYRPRPAFYAIGHTGGKVLGRWRARVAGAEPPPGYGGRAPWWAPATWRGPSAWIDKGTIPPIMPTRAAADLRRESQIDSMPPSSPAPASSISWLLAPDPDTATSTLLLRLETIRAS